jgi:hypothetical protein
MTIKNGIRRHGSTSCASMKVLLMPAHAALVGAVVTGMDIVQSQEAWNINKERQKNQGK